MAEFVLVHGSGQNAACWARVGEVLRARGHAVVAPDLPKRMPEWGLEDYAARIAGSISDPQAVIVAHSLCGAFLPLVPRIRPCGRLVYLAAVIPEPGKSIRQQHTEDSSMFCREWIAAGARWFDETQREGLAKEFLFHDCEEASLPWALSTLESLDPQRLVTQPSPFTEWPAVPVTSIVATGDRTLSPEWIRRRTRLVLRSDPIEFPSGHCPQNSRPEQLAALISETSVRCQAPN